MGFTLKPARTPTAHWRDAILSLILSAIFFCILVPVAQNEYAFTQSAARASGVVIAQNHGKHHVEVQFTGADGKVIHYSQNGNVSYEVGDKVTVYYNPNNPSQLPSTDGIGALWVNTIFVALMTFGFFLIAMGLIFFPKYFHGPFSRAQEKREKQLIKLKTGNS